jgi:hypothetical protein
VSLGGLSWGLFGGLSSDANESHTSEQAGEKESGKGDDEPSDWVRVCTVYNPIEAQIGAARLNDQGIPVRIRQESASSALPVTFGILGAMHLYVPEPKAEQATIILEETMGPPDENEDD